LRFPLLLLESSEKQREDLQILYRIGDAVCDFSNTTSIMKPERGAEAQRSNDEPATSVKPPVVNKARDHQETENRRRRPNCPRFQEAFPHGPAVHPFRMDYGPDILTEDSKVFAKIEAVAKLVNSLLPFRNLGARRRRQQPACERSIAGARA